MQILVVGIEPSAVTGTVRTRRAAGHQTATCFTSSDSVCDAGATGVCPLDKTHVDVVGAARSLPFSEPTAAQRVRCASSTSARRG